MNKRKSSVSAEGYDGDPLTDAAAYTEEEQDVSAQAEAAVSAAAPSAAADTTVDHSDHIPPPEDFHYCPCFANFDPHRIADCAHSGCEICKESLDADGEFVHPPSTSAAASAASSSATAAVPDTKQDKPKKKKEPLTVQTKPDSDGFVDGARTRWLCSKIGCLEKFLSAESRNTHMREVHQTPPNKLVRADEDVTKEFRCRILGCDYVSAASGIHRDATARDKHEANKHGVNNRTLTDKGLYLQSGREVAAVSKKPVYVCTFCKAEVHNISRHKEKDCKKNPNKGQFRCDYARCPTLFQTAEAREQHHKEKHSALDANGFRPKYRNRLDLPDPKDPSRCVITCRKEGCGAKWYYYPSSLVGRKNAKHNCEMHTLDYHPEVKNDIEIDAAHAMTLLPSSVQLSAASATAVAETEEKKTPKKKKNPKRQKTTTNTSAAAAAAPAASTTRVVSTTTTTTTTTTTVMAGQATSAGVKAGSGGVGGGGGGGIVYAAAIQRTSSGSDLANLSLPSPSAGPAKLSYSQSGGTGAALPFSLSQNSFSDLVLLSQPNGSGTALPSVPLSQKSLSGLSLYYPSTPLPQSAESSSQPASDYSLSAIFEHNFMALANKELDNLPSTSSSSSAAAYPDP